MSAFGVIAAIQPLLAYEMTGPQNAIRLANQGLWTAVALGALMASRAVAATPFAALLIVTPLLYGTEHLVSFPNGWASPLGHRAATNLWVAAVCTLASMKVCNLRRSS